VESIQQFSTPIGLAYVASVAGEITPADVVLEPSAGTGFLAIVAELDGASLILNEFAESRAGSLSDLFPAVSTTSSTPLTSTTTLDCRHCPSVVLMNPPFSAAVHCRSTYARGALRHVGSALARLPEGGRLVNHHKCERRARNPAWTEPFIAAAGTWA